MRFLDAIGKRGESETKDARELGFDRIAMFSFTGTQPAPVVPPSMDIFGVPSNVSRAVVRGLAVVGQPIGQFLNNVSWSVRISRGGAQEYVMGSRNATSGATAAIADSGMRWSMLGSLARPAVVSIGLDQGQTLGLVFTNIANLLNNAPFTVYARAMGVMYR